ncbi:dihydropteroate synthase [Catenovulum sp. SX2]|uniref:dihydropteroate synthase n=1 Tax=Catenovulum sp. SX2 TaxID=3398614 RepID=UPI003F86AF81
MKIQQLIHQSSRPLVMGILNVTPDSFSDGGHFHLLDSALKHCQQMLDLGVDIIDIGGESTRPGAEYVPLEQEMQRVLPVLERIKQEFNTYVSIDTYKPQLMAEAINLGADMINDVRALAEPEALSVVAASEVDVCLMHMRGNPRTMQQNTQYSNVVDEVNDFLQQRIQACVDMGINPQRICIDPGFGFGKSVEQNYQMLQQFEQFQQLGYPVLAGLSRKSMLGAATAKEPAERIDASVAAATIAAMKGANIIRVHDVAQTIDAMAVVAATLKEQ